MVETEKSLAVDLDKWKNNRKWMYLNFCISAFMYGLSTTAYYPTEYLYFKDVIKVANPGLFYGLSWAFMCGAGVLTSLIGSYYADSTKNIRSICLLTNIVNVAGNILYVLYYSPYFVLFGQMLVGTAAARIVVGTGEISRVYDSHELTQKMSLIGAVFGLGSVTGPCTLFIFQYVDTDILGWKLNVCNMIGVCMAILFLLEFILNYFTLKNVSKEFTLKKSSEKKKLLSNENENKSEDEEFQNEENEDAMSFKEQYMIALKTVMGNKQIILLFLICFVTTYSRGTLSLLQPIKGTEYLHWQKTNLATFLAICICTGALPTLLLLAYVSKYVNDFFLLLCSLMLLIVALITMGFLPMTSGEHKTSEIIIYASGITALQASSSLQVLLRSITARFVPENVQTMTEAIRNSLYELSFVVAGLSVQLSSMYLTQTMFAMAVIVSILMACFIVDNKSFREIKEIEPDYE